MCLISPHSLHPMFFPFLASALAEILVLRDRDAFTMEFDVIENKICSGFLKPLGGKNTTYKAAMHTESGSILFSSASLRPDEETHFSFSVDRPTNMRLVVTPVVLDRAGQPINPDLEISFNAQFDTFKKDVAKRVSVEPAMAAMTRLDNLLYELSRESEYLAHKMGRIDYEHRRMFSFVTIFSVITLAIYFAVNSYELYSLKRFFKMKKMI